MRTRINVTFEAGTRSIDTSITDLTIEDIRLIVNETQKKVLCSSMQKDLISTISNGVVTYASTLPVLAEGDKITFEIDQGKIEQVLIPMTSAEVTEMVEDIITDESEES